ncbi:M61 family metallopeptidase [Spirosoma endophyticum]|uniref:Predicted metalloprotease, contains C-terminal PDZ domain n=1 Tax=Spirosoma endophyticum TaxID=662367 RepID=A0A1I2EK98_9BACT|nr:peptidase [Spirosoma endophyticum]SFE93534.1 Predicted metalloprotease, contains C-terminal PDZ domain [Spirosoma endophyticum]
MKILHVLFLVSATLFSPFALAKPTLPLLYEVNLNDRADDQFKVTLHVDGLTADNAIYQFAATAPGTYQIMDIGRYVRSFKAFDKKGREVKTEQVSTNQWKFEKPEVVRTVQYSIAETWDTPINEHKPYNMCGTSIENDHVLINGQGVFGFPSGLQAAPIDVKIDYPADWAVGTALEKNAKGYFTAANYDRIVDSPILLGRLTKATTTVAGAQVDVYTYSKTDKIKSDQLLNNMQSMLNAAGQFLKQLPVKRYTFLYHFEDQEWGAWEHSYSSEYAMKEGDFTKAFADNVTSIAAHEFFHVVTPLNIHSEVIEQFNFVTPTPSEHLWLYEGVTEWASDAMQLRGQIMDLPTYLDELSQKIDYDKSLDTTYSLSKLGLTCYTNEGQRQYGNIYARGALVAGLLDIRLLELSNGKRGLREVVNELAATYGPNKAFPEKDFFAIFAQKTYPEIADFFNRYVKATEPLPFKEYYGKLGISYLPAVPTGQKIASVGMRPSFNNNKFYLTKLDDALRKAGLQEDDEWLTYNQQPVTLENIGKIQRELMQLKAGDTYDVTVRRNGQEVPVKNAILEKELILRYKFEPDPQATPQQVQLRDAWMKNL